MLLISLACSRKSTEADCGVLGRARVSRIHDRLKSVHKYIRYVFNGFRDATEAASKYERIIYGCLQALRHFLLQVPSQSDLEESYAHLLSNSKFWKFQKHESDWVSVCERNHVRVWQQLSHIAFFLLDRFEPACMV